jgi:hypothetical protein
MDRFHTNQRVFVKKDEDDRVINQHGTVVRLLSHGVLAWVLLDAKGGGTGTEKILTSPGDCDPSNLATRPERRAALAESREPAPTLATFGKDHWSTFAYIETRIVDHSGFPYRQHMRCHGDRHPLLVVPDQDGRSYPTILKGGAVLTHHDDWDCLDDLEREGLLVNIGSGLHRCYELTADGRTVAAALRAHKAAGGAYATFSPSGVRTAEVA